MLAGEKVHTGHTFEEIRGSEPVIYDAERIAALRALLAEPATGNGGSGFG
jgi:hypothetical protein